MKSASSKKVMLSAVKPNHQLTLGSYLGALKNWVQMQKDYDCLFFVVDLHAITTRQDPKILKELTYSAIAYYIACGIDPEQSPLFVQSHVPEHVQLGWILTCFSYMGELSRMTQFKDKSTHPSQNIPTGLFVYPTLMAADILLYKTHLVPVGADQIQHIEITRDLALRFNHTVKKDIFVIPEAFIPKTGARIMNLQDPTSKMSKSDRLGENGVIFLDESESEISNKIRRAVTDSGSEITDDKQKPGIKNLLEIQSAITGEIIPTLLSRYAGKQYGHLKTETADLVVQTLKPIREKAKTLLKDLSYLDEILDKGAQKAQQRAHPVIKQVHDCLGFL